MKTFKWSKLLAAIGWVSVFVLMWLLVLRLVPSDFLTWSGFVLFFTIGLLASSISR